MLLVFALKAATCATVAILGGNSARNMIQTARVVSRQQSSGGGNSSNDAHGDPPSAMISAIPEIFRSAETAIISSDEAVRQLQSMERKELLELFLHSAAPATTTELQGKWNGLLLDNNSFVMDSVSSILTHRLFGGPLSTRWMGKCFDGSSCSTGSNRFVATQKNGATAEETQKHRFDTTIESSMLQPSKKSLHLKYYKYQTGLSLWKTMEDELRIVPNTNGEVMIGMGCLHATGSMYNAAPFCLYMVSA